MPDAGARYRPLTAAILAAVVVAAVFGMPVTSDGDDRRAPESSASASSVPESVAAPRPPDAVVADGAGAELYGFESWDDMRTNASLVAIVTVQSEEEVHIKTWPEDDLISSMRNVTLLVEQTLLGDAHAGDTFVIRDLGWFTTGGERTEVVYVSAIRLRPGDRAFVALIGDGKDPETSALLNSDAVIILNDPIGPADRSNPFAATLEALSAAELIEVAKAEL